MATITHNLEELVNDRQRHRRHRSLRPVALLGLVVLLAVPSRGEAGGLHVWPPNPRTHGSWQANIDCTGQSSTRYAVATSFLEIGQRAGSDDVYGRITGCGSIAVPGAIRRFADCEGDEEIGPVGQVGPPGVQLSTNEVHIPAVGSFAALAHPTSSFPFPLVGCDEVVSISSLTMFDVSYFLEGGELRRMTGSVQTELVQMHDASGAICYEAADVGCRTEMRRNAVTTGDGVEVEPLGGVRVMFAHALSAGTVEVIPVTELDAVLPPGLRSVDGAIELAFDVSTSADFEGPITVCARYLDDDDDGLVDGTDPAVPEDRVRFLHEENGMFVDRTHHLDTQTNEVCARTHSLSQFAMRATEEAEAAPELRRIPVLRPARGLQSRLRAARLLRR